MSRPLFSSRVLVSLGFSLAALSLCQCGASSPPPKAETKGEAEAPKDVADPRYQALPIPKETPEYTPPPVKKTALKSGLTFWHMYQDTTPLVSIHLMLPTGGAADPVGKEGLALLTADMLDEGAGKHSALELSDKLGELATDYSSSAGVDYVLLSMEALSENLEESLALLADIVLRPKLSKEEFDRRKKHHLAAALTARDEPDSARAKALSHALFGEGYAGAPATGTHSSLEAITYADMKKHAKALTVPEGAHLAIAGLFDPENAQAAIEKEFGDWKGKLTTTRREISSQDFAKKAFVIDFPEASQSSLAIMTTAGSESDPNYFAQEVMNDRLGHSFTSRINMNLREDKGYTYGAASIFRRYQRAGYFGVFTNVKSEATGASIREVFRELSDICQGRPLTEQERNEAVEGLLLGYPMQFDEVSALGYRLITLPVRDRPADFWITWPDNIEAVTTARANEAAKEYCDTSRYGVVIAGNQSLIKKELSALGLQVVEMDREGRVKESASPKPD